MAMITTNPKRWLPQTAELRRIVLSFPLTEARKWGKPCFMLDGKNVVLIQAFKDYIALMFFKGALLKDTKKLLVQPGQLQSARQLRYVTVEDIAAAEPIIKAYVKEAIALEKSGARVEKKATSDFAVPEELSKKFAEMPELKKAFAALTPGRQRGYLFHFAQPKQSKTREARVEKYVPRILRGEGFMERERSK